MKMFILSYKGGKDGGDIDKEDTSKFFHLITFSFQNTNHIIYYNIT